MKFSTFLVLVMVIFTLISMLAFLEPATNKTYYEPAGIKTVEPIEKAEREPKGRGPGRVPNYNTEAYKQAFGLGGTTP